MNTAMFVAIMLVVVVTQASADHSQCDGLYQGCGYNKHCVYNKDSCPGDNGCQLVCKPITCDDMYEYAYCGYSKMCMYNKESCPDSDDPGCQLQCKQITCDYLGYYAYCYNGHVPGMCIFNREGCVSTAMPGCNLICKPFYY